MSILKRESNMSKLQSFAFHMKNRKTNEIRIKKVEALDVTHAHCNDVGYKSDWCWTGTEPFRNVENKVYHIGRGYYKFKEGNF